MIDNPVFGITINEVKSMNEFSTYEFAVAQKTEGKWLLARIALIVFYVIYPIVLVLFGMKFSLFVPLLCFIPISLWLIIFITWRFVSVEYEYSTVSGTLTFAKIFGNRSRRRVFEMTIRDAVLIAPLSDGSAAARGKAYAPEREFMGASSLSCPDVYFMLFELHDKKSGEKRRAIYYFEATQKMLAICRYYNPSATVLSAVSR